MLSRYCHAGDKGENKYSSYSLFTSALDGCEWSASCPNRAVPPGKGHLVGGWVYFRAALESAARGKILCLCRESNTGHPVVQFVVRHYTDLATPVPGKEAY
jgi:hypothetical protein